MLLAALLSVLAMLAALSGLVSTVARGALRILTVTGAFVPGRKTIRIALRQATARNFSTEPISRPDPGAARSSQLA